MITLTPFIGLPMYDAGEDSGSTRYGGRRAYADCVQRAGGLPVFLPPMFPEDAPALLNRLDGILLPGGGDVDPALFGQAPHPKLGAVDRALDAFEIALVREARRRGKPVLGICRGVQVLNVACGGDLHQDIPTCVISSVSHSGVPRTETAHTVVLSPRSLLHSLFGPDPLPVNSLHHQAPARVGDGLSVSGVCPDDGLVEALEDPRAAFCVGVQFHPEDLGSRLDPLFAAFVEACRTESKALPD